MKSLLEHIKDDLIGLQNEKGNTIYDNGKYSKIELHCTKHINTELQSEFKALYNIAVIDDKINKGIVITSFKIPEALYRTIEIIPDIKSGFYLKYE